MLRRGMGRVGRPGLIGTMARTAVVAGTATAVAGGVSRHQQAKAQQKADAQSYDQQQQMDQQQPPAPPPQPAAPPPQPAAPPPQVDVISQLKDLAALKDQGILTDEEFAQQKARILA
ncbi:SHOCT domain-containing protein [Kribbella sp. NPDC026596]|uniref:SHOCT domain-containing protein n=1 Tax=Kribbella sp. NPDC026596 TaxID=3155122 RepID=UPI0033EE91A5